ncbi:MAG: hypothetical protein IT292_11530 [Deltaproteobacteria bacterium]|nr:hypothetical protein [Deltaproteobacteria bacterium]
MKKAEACASYPTTTHQRAAEAATSFFSSKAEVEAILLTCSCARGKATKDSCIDIAVLAPEAMLADKKDKLELEWQDYYQQDNIFSDLHAVGVYSHIDLLLFSGNFHPAELSWTTGADEFELAIGHLVAYAVPLFERNSRFQELRKRWLLYYSED